MIESNLGTLPDGSDPPGCTLLELVQDVPLHSARRIQELFWLGTSKGQSIAFPREIRAHCGNEDCAGVRRHHKENQNELILGDDKSSLFYLFVVYYCCDCLARRKVFAFKAQYDGAIAIPGICTKIYQEPQFGSPIPKRLYHVIGEENREHFLQARRAIARGLGIGAFAYYRRIVENTKLNLVSSVLEFAQATNASPAQIDLLKKAQSERQFSKAMEMLGDVSAIPAVLLINGQNPLLLLHDLLSEGIHQVDDRECLERAQETEVILCDIASRMHIALTENKSVKAALASIMKRTTKRESGEANS
jgi:hypothetical protein